jgi:hypothetical protein
MMKRALKVTFGAVLAVGTLGTAQANMEQLVNHFGVQVTGTYTQATENAQSFGDQFVALPLAGGGGRFVSPVFVENDYDFDYGLGLMYGFTDKTRVYFNYDHFSTSDDSSASNITNISIGSTANAPTSGNGSVSYNANEYDLGVGHLWEHSPRFAVDYRAQLQWDRFAQSFVETIRGTPLAGGRDNAIRTTNNTFRGFGPGVGLMAHAKPITNCPTIGVFAGGIASLMYGRNEFAVVAYNDILPQYQVTPENSHSIVGKLDIKFGVDYSNHFNMDCGKVPYALALGMRYMNAFNAFKNGNTQVAGIDLETVAVNTQPWAINQGTPADFGRFGPYLQLSVGAFS